MAKMHWLIFGVFVFIICRISVYLSSFILFFIQNFYFVHKMFWMLFYKQHTAVVYLIVWFNLSTYDLLVLSFLLSSFRRQQLFFPSLVCMCSSRQHVNSRLRSNKLQFGKPAHLKSMLKYSFIIHFRWLFALAKWWNV